MDKRLAIHDPCRSVVILKYDTYQCQAKYTNQNHKQFKYYFIEPNVSLMPVATSSENK